MKNVVNKGYIPLLFLMLFACTTPEKSDSKLQNSNSEKLYDVYYLDVLGTIPQYNDKDKIEFIITKKIYVLDSCFGIYNEVNQEKAYKYCATTNKSNDVLNILYEIKTKHDNQVLFDVFVDINLLASVILDHGYAYRNGNLYKFLRIQLRWDNTLDLWCLNFEFDNNMQWKLLSKEYINTSLGATQQVGYCIDTVTKHINTKETGIPKNRINFMAAFDDLTTICNQEVQ